MFTAYIEHDAEVAVYVGTMPGLAGAHSQAAMLGELQANLQEVVVTLIHEEQQSRQIAVEV